MCSLRPQSVPSDGCDLRTGQAAEERRAGAETPCASKVATRFVAHRRPLSRWRRSVCLLRARRSRPRGAVPSSRQNFQDVVRHSAQVSAPEGRHTGDDSRQREVSDCQTASNVGSGCKTLERRLELARRHVSEPAHAPRNMRPSGKTQRMQFNLAVWTGSTLLNRSSSEDPR